METMRESGEMRVFIQMPFSCVISMCELNRFSLRGVGGNSSKDVKVINVLK